MKPNPLQERVGTAEISRTEPIVAGSFVDFTITYTAGYFGIDDTGSIKICTRFATDMGRPQFAAPAQPNYVSIVAICFLIDFAALLYAKGFKLLALDCERTPNTATSC